MKTMRLVLLSFVVLHATGCSLGRDNLADWIEEVKSRKTTTIEQQPVVTPHEAYAYSSVGLRDPFTIATQDQDLTDIADRGREREPLEEFALDELTYAGSVVFNNTKVAIVRDPAGLIHRVNVGSHMGRNNGKVLTIQSKMIEIVERIRDASGAYTPSTIEFKMPEKPDGKR